MNKLPLKTRSLILNMLCEGQSMRATARLADVSFNTVAKLLIDAGKVCADLHDELVQGVTASCVQGDEVWSFTYAAKQKNVATAKAAPQEAGDTWTWTALDADTKLIVSSMVGGRDAEYANAFMGDVASRLANRERDALRQRFGRYILVATNFGRYNHFMGYDFHLAALKKRGTITTPEQIAFYRRWREYLGELYRGFALALPVLARAFPDHHIVVRPHPSEDHEAWRRETHGLDAVTVGI